MLEGLFGIIENAAKIVLAPVEIALDVTRAVTKPVSDLAKKAVEEIKDLTDTDKW